MTNRIVVLSDLHLANGHPIFDAFGARQQAAFEGLLRATEPGRPLGNAGEDGTIELIINGDCFDLLAIPPYLADGISTPAIARAKLETILPVHRPFFAALGRFLRIAGGRVMFLPGNHDIELGFIEAQAFVRQAIMDASADESGSAGQSTGDGDLAARISFSQTRFYRPLPAVYIEHGNQFDFWNHARDLWDAGGYLFSPRPARLTLPVGSQYFQRASHPISTRYPYFDAFEPSIDSTRQIALLCLLNPDIVVEIAHRTMRMLSYPRTALAGLTSEEQYMPAMLFEKAMLDFAAFQQDMMAQNPAWQAVDVFLHTHPANQQDSQAEAIKQFVELREMLTLSPIEAARAILTPSVYQMGESVAMGMHNILRDDPTLRYGIAGHTHMLRRDRMKEGMQVYLNTASWTKRSALPAAEQVTPALVEWLRHPADQPDPLRDMTSFVFALVDEQDEQDRQPATAKLCEWEGGLQGFYHELT